MGIYVAVIDGTGPWTNAEYAMVMQVSFCRQIANQMGANAKYFRGPAALGLGVRPEASGAADWLRKMRTKDKSARLMLAGYSRGASAAIYAAELLAETKDAADSLFLFDAVARHIYSGGEVMPANVSFSRHAQRSQDPAFVARYEGSIGRFSNPTRPSFGNTGITYSGTGDHLRKVFQGSHGALGGVGWTVVKEDTVCQALVADWFNGIFKSRGLPVSLVSMPPSRKAFAANFVRRFARDIPLVVTSMTRSMDEKGMATDLFNEHGADAERVREVFEELDQHRNSDADDVAEAYVGLLMQRGGAPLHAVRRSPALRDQLIKVLDEGWTSAGEKRCIAFLRQLG